ncbi:hypothetical protein [Pseudothermotoga thermarum]|uniref:DUF4203 domain-containing protein n=1 Tax=Pseudothermotoga thermarum DSM 5069 TaxID=688269 RepID=F7YVN4_9THEM|nr:hypothetical protein [Pseudothermotoga thermarum]AEH51699.1 hypothetical protein Theth_1651 [Pseudothermotoga thermarum DSM 5069]
MGDLGNQLLYVLDLWYILVPIAFFLVFAAKYVERVAISFFGFILGGYVLLPILIERFDKIKNWVSNNYLIALIIAGLIGAIVLYLLYKIFVFLVGFFVFGAVTYFVVDMIFKNFELTSKLNSFIQENWFAILLGFSAVIGVIGGLLAIRKSSTIVAVIGAICGSFILAVEAVGWIYYLYTRDMQETINAFSETAVLVVVAILTVVILFLSLVLMKKAEKEKQKQA